MIGTPSIAHALTCATLLATALAPLAAHAQEADLETGAALFAENCAACHGTEAQGDGPVAATLATQPPDLTRIAARRDGVWPIFEVMSILDGYTRETTPRADMPILSALTDGPMVDLVADNGLTTQVPAGLLAVADYLESLQSPPPERYLP